jgi:hypothetical protein
MTARWRFRLDARVVGAILCLAGLAALGFPSLIAGAIGLELIAAAFWWWSRAAEHPGEQIERWSWLRRPAAALWLAVALQAVTPVPGFMPSVFSPELPIVLAWLRALAVVWAGLELLAALPLSRPFSDVPGPLLAMRPWLPALMPAAGFVVLWRNSALWVPVIEVRQAAVALLLFTAWLAALRALSRRHWTAGLRWLLVTDSALAGVLVALDAVPRQVSFLLWLGACGGRAFLLAGELRGAAPRRGPVLSRMWRVASLTASAGLAWPALVALAGRPFEPVRLLVWAAAAVPVALTAAVTVRRQVEAPERRLLMRPHHALTLSHLAAALTLALAPVALAIAWWSGFEAGWPSAWLAVLPALAGGAVAILRRPRPEDGVVRAAARSTFRGVVSRERGMVELLDRLAGALTAPLRDLHTGDAQEYLLFLVGVAVLALLLPLLQ